MTKALTGLVIADSVNRRELDLDFPVSTYLAQLVGFPAREVTLRELVTHRAGYVQVGTATTRRAVWSALVGRNWVTDSTDQVMKQAEAGTLATRGSYVYSTLGTAVAG